MFFGEKSDTNVGSVESLKSRRTIVKGAAWSLPVIAMAVAAPSASASVTPPSYAIESNFGSGWYPTRQGQTASGALQYDSKTSMGKYLRIVGTEAGDVVTLISFKVLISVGWPVVTYTALPGSNSNWSTLAATGATEIINGVSYRVYTSTFSGAVTATGSVTDIPIDFFFRVNTPYFAGQTYQTTRYATVLRGATSTSVTLAREVAPLVNTNVLLANAPTP